MKCQITRSLPFPVAQLIRTARSDQPELIVDMNKLTHGGSWNPTTANFKSESAQLTDDDLLLLEQGHEEMLSGRIQKQIDEPEDREPEIRVNP
jgi:hypothetical protein